MLLFSEGVVHVNDPFKEKVEGAGGFGVIANGFPGLLHIPTPVDIIKYKEAAFM